MIHAKEGYKNERSWLVLQEVNIDFEVDSKGKSGGN